MRLTGLIGLLTLAAPLPAQRTPVDLPIREHVFANGLRLLVLERPGDPRVSCKIFTDMGGLLETPGYSGAAHFLEHIMFKGTHTLGTSDWSAERPLYERLLATEAALTAELNRARNDLQERGVFHDYAHARSTPRADSLRAEIRRLDGDMAPYRVNGDMVRWYQAFGATGITATTEQEWMKFDVNLPRERVELFFRVEADRMRNSVFREFDQERMILVEQRIGDLNRPATPYYEAMNGAVSQYHPVFWSEGYYPEDFYHYTRQYQQRLYDSTFQPNNTTLVLIGGVTLPEMIPLVERYFGEIPRAPEPPRMAAVEPIPQAERRLIWRSTTLEPRVEARFMVPGVGHPDRPHFDVLAEVIELQLSDVLRAASLAGRVDANFRVVHTSRFGVPASINVEVVLSDEARLGEAETVLLGVLDDLGRRTVAADRLALAKKRLRTDWYRTLLNADQLGFEIGHFQIMDRWQTLPVFLEARERSTAEDLARIARRYFVPENRTIGIVRRPAGRERADQGGRP